MEQFKKYTGRENELKSLIGKQKDNQDDLYDRVKQTADRVERIVRGHSERLDDRTRELTEKFDRAQTNFSAARAQLGRSDSQYLSLSRDLDKLKESIQSHKDSFARPAAKADDPPAQSTPQEASETPQVSLKL
eukprot:SAG22_NODE_159_length_16948_cov_14.480503_9_plen_133_part_00